MFDDSGPLTHEVCSLYCISLGPIYLALEITCDFTVAAILDETGTSKFIARLNANQVLLSNFTSQNDCFTITSMKKCTIKHVTLQQFSFLLKICVKKLYQTVNVFHLRLCRLLKEPKRPIRTEGTVPG